MSDGIDISVIMPVWNTPSAILDRSVASFLWQVKGNFNYELIIVDDGSTSNDTMAMLSALDNVASKDSYLQIITLPKRVGIGAARNHGLLRARGNYIALLDSDDELFSASLIARYEYALAKRLHFVHGLYCERVLHVTGKQIAIRAPKGYDMSDDSLKTPPTTEECRARLKQHNILATCTMLCRRDLMLWVGGFEPGLVCSEDWLTWRRIFNINGAKCGFLDEPLAYYNVFYPTGSLNTHMTLDAEFEGAFHLNIKDPQGAAGEYLDSRAEDRAVQWSNHSRKTNAEWGW